MDPRLPFQPQPQPQLSIPPLLLVPPLPLPPQLSRPPLLLVPPLPSQPPSQPMFSLPPPPYGQRVPQDHPSSYPILPQFQPFQQQRGEDIESEIRKLKDQLEKAEDAEEVLRCRSQRLEKEVRDLIEQLDEERESNRKKDYRIAEQENEIADLIQTNLRSSQEDKEIIQRLKDKADRLDSRVQNQQKLIDKYKTELDKSRKENVKLTDDVKREESFGNRATKVMLAQVDEIRRNQKEVGHLTAAFNGLAKAVVDEGGALRKLINKSESSKAREGMGEGSFSSASISSALALSPPASFPQKSSVDDRRSSGKKRKERDPDVRTDESQAYFGSSGPKRAKHHDNVSGHVYSSPYDSMELRKSPSTL